MVIEVTIETIVVFLVFTIFIFVFYKLFKFFERASMISIASFAFPWVAKYVGLPITANIETAITFSFIGLGIFLVYEFYHFAVQFFKLLAWPFRRKKKK